jgi:hypothetical protein
VPGRMKVSGHVGSLVGCPDVRLASSQLH